MTCMPDGRYFDPVKQYATADVHAALPCTATGAEQHWRARRFAMQVKVVGDNHVKATAELARDVEASAETALKRFGQQITRVEVHLADENSHKRGDSDKQCTVEAHVAGLQ